MVQPINHRGVTTSTTLQDMSSKASGPRADYYATTLVSASHTKLKDYAFKAWNFFTDTLSYCFETTLWLVTCGMSTPNRKEIAEEIIENPEEMAKEFAAKPKERIAELITACIVDPAAVQKLRDDNPDKVGEFIRAFKKELAADNQSFAAGMTPADRTYLQAQLIVFIDGQYSKMLDTLESIRPTVLTIVGEKKEGEKKEVTALRELFADYLPKVLAFGKKDPTKLKSVFQEFVKVFTKKGNFDVTVLKQIPELNDEAGIKNLLRCLDDKSFCLRALSQPHVLGLPDASKLDLIKACCSTFLRQLSPKQVPVMKKLVSDDYVLVNGVLDELRGVLSSRSERVQMSDNYAQAWTLIQQLNTDLANPPPPIAKA